MSRKMIVAIPLIMIARFASSPMTIGKTKVAPNIATTCCAPIPTVRGHDSRSSGATASPRSGVYADSVRLMQVSRDVGAREGVTAVLVAMATPLNVDLAAGMGLAPEEG